MGFLKMKYRIFVSKSALNRAMSLIEKFVINELSKAVFKAGNFLGLLNCKEPLHVRRIRRHYPLRTGR